MNRSAWPDPDLGVRPAQRGAASAEFAIVLPLVVVSLLLLVQVALLVSFQLNVTHAAREGARAAAIWNDDDRARDAALRSGALDAAHTDVVVEPAIRSVGDPVRVTVRYHPPIVVPFVGRFVPESLVLTATVQTLTERDPS